MNIQTFEANVLKYERLLYHVSWSMLSSQEDCADAVQEALTRAWQNRHTLRNEKAFKSWLVHILTNVCQDMLRKRPKHPAVPLDDDKLAALPGGSDALSMVDLLQSLSPEHRLAVVMYYVEGYRVHEIARILNMPAGTIKSRLSSARTALRKTIAPHEAAQGRCHI